MLSDPSVLREIQHRDDISEFLNRHDLVGDAVELGTFHGEFAARVLAGWNGRRLNLIDPYRHFQDGEYVDGCAIDHQTGKPVDFEEMFCATHALLKDFPPAYFIRQTSAAACPQFDDLSLDFIYVDANHSPKSVREDIGLWWPKLQHGGVMGLHDCYTRNDGQLACGVFDAVMDFAEQIGQRPHVTYCTTAWFCKVHPPT